MDEMRNVHVRYQTDTDWEEIKSHTISGALIEFYNRHSLEGEEILEARLAGEQNFTVYCIEQRFDITNTGEVVPEEETDG